MADILSTIFRQYPIMKSLTTALWVAIGVAAAKNDDSQNSLRVEWRDLPEATQIGYVEAVKCLDTLPSKLGLETSRYNDFSYVHSALNLQSIYLIDIGLGHLLIKR